MSSGVHWFSRWMSFAVKAIPRPGKLASLWARAKKKRRRKLLNTPANLKRRSKALKMICRILKAGATIFYSEFPTLRTNLFRSVKMRKIMKSLKPGVNLKKKTGGRLTGNWRMKKDGLTLTGDLKSREPVSRFI